MCAHRWVHLLVLLAPPLLVAGACTDAAEERNATEAVRTTEEPDDRDGSSVDRTEARSVDEDTAGAPGFETCPNPLIVQTDWFPTPEQGATYQLTAGVGDWEGGRSAFVGPLWADPSIEVQIRPGGPFIGFRTTSSAMYRDDDIFLGSTSVDASIAHIEEFPTVAVVAPLAKDPQMIMWDPATHPDIESFSDVRATGATVNVFADSAYVEYLVSTGRLHAEQVDPSYDASPTRFVAEEGNIFQHGVATQEPWNYEHLVVDWGEPVDFLLIHDSGFQPYSNALGLRSDLLEDPAVQDCLSALVPVVQQSIIHFQTDPQPVIDAIERTLVDIDDFWQLSEESMASTVAVMDELGIVGNEGDDTIGDFDLDRVATLIAQLDSEVGSVDVPEGLTPEDVVTNDYIDPSIGR